MNVALIGNPNCGKTTLFNLLTGAKQRVGNWPGVTVERKIGVLNYQNNHYTIVDLPGTYAIESDPLSVSQDELITRQFVLSEKESVMINIIDATNLQRSLYLTLQLIDLQLPMVVVLNMTDALKMTGEQIDTEQLSHILGCPVIAISSKRKTGIDLLYQQIEKISSTKQVTQPAMNTLSRDQEAVITRYIEELPANSQVHQFNRWQLIDALLDGSRYQLTPCESEKLNACRLLLSAWCDYEIDVALASARYDVIDNVCKNVINKPRELSSTFSEKLDKIALGRITGIPLFLLAMYVMFTIAINFGSIFIDFFDGFFNTIFVEGLSYLLHQLDAPIWMNIILADGIGTGIKTVSTFIPVIAAMFFVLSFLEDSGYLARAAMMVDRPMRCIGLPGKAFVPMLVGFGCGVPAIMGTRTLESTRDRIMSICMIPFMSCGARLPVYALFAVIFFPRHASMVVFSLYLLGIFVALATGYILKLTLLKGQPTPFIMEMPVYRIPTLQSMFKLTWQRLKSFITKAGKAIVIMVTVLSLLNSLGTDGRFGHEQSNDSLLAAFSQTITPALAPMGLDKQNWPATVGLFTGVFAKEAVIATLNSLYSMDNQQQQRDNFDFNNSIKASILSIPKNLLDFTDTILDPLGFSSLKEDIDDIENDLVVDSTTVAKIKTSFMTHNVAIAYLIFILLYTPCAAALGAIYREAGIRWMVFVALWTFIVGWLVATIYYQITLLGQSVSAIYWLMGCAAFIGAMILLMRWLGQYSSLNMSPKLHHDTTNGSCCCDPSSK